MRHGRLNNISKQVEMSPNGRYIRSDEKRGSGAYKEVYLGYDIETGAEIAWNHIDLTILTDNEQKRIKNETTILKSLNHQHIIEFKDSWENNETQQMYFVTEIVTSGTLKQYINRMKYIKLKVIKQWCQQILHVLNYLHSQPSPIIHRDLKCDNIFINGNTSSILIGDFGLSRNISRQNEIITSVVGTPEFMAPELYDSNYSQSVDIYAFGMCVLEMITREYPYEECNNAAQIWKHVSNGKKPQVIERIKDKETKEFILLCISHDVNMRPTASQLMLHPYLLGNHKQDDSIIEVEPPLKVVNISINIDKLIQQQQQQHSVNVSLSIFFNIGAKKNIKFTFDFTRDDFHEIATDMMKTLILPNEIHTQDMIESTIRTALTPYKRIWSAYILRYANNIYQTHKKNNHKNIAPHLAKNSYSPIQFVHFIFAQCKYYILKIFDLRKPNNYKTM